MNDKQKMNNLVLLSVEEIQEEQDETTQANGECKSAPEIKITETILRTNPENTQLYEHHIVKDELVIGPEVIQKTCTNKDCVQKNTGHFQCVTENENYRQRNLAECKSEPEIKITETILRSNPEYKQLYKHHIVKDELVIGPEVIQKTCTNKDCVQKNTGHVQCVTENENYRQRNLAECKSEPEIKITETILRSNPEYKQLYKHHIVKDELVIGPEVIQKTCTNKDCVQKNTGHVQCVTENENYRQRNLAECKSEPEIKITETILRSNPEYKQLYKHHIVKDELVIGPEVIQKTCTNKDCVQKNTGHVQCVTENDNYRQRNLAECKSEPEIKITETILSSNPEYKQLYEHHIIKDELVIGPEVIHMTVGKVSELPIMSPLEKALHVRRKRTWTPPGTSTSMDVVSDMERPPSPSMPGTSTSMDVDVERAPSPSLPGMSVPMDMAFEQVPSPAMFLESGGSGASSHHQRGLSDPDICYALNYGSEPESDEEDDDDDDGNDAFYGKSRAALAFADTPVDDDVPEQSSPVPSFSQEDLNTEVSPFLHRPTEMYDFEWRAFPDTPIPPQERREPFSVPNVGVVTPRDDPYSTFVAIWDRPIMEQIVEQTNIYAQQLAQKMMEQNTLTPTSRICDWRDTNVDELYVYFALIITMGMVVKGNAEDYWSNVADVFSTPNVSRYMSLRRFQILGKCLHFANNATMPQGLQPSEAKLFKIEPLLTHLNHKCESMYTLGQNIALDESLLQWKGWLDINQSIPNKAASVGIKTYEICESQTGYLWRFEIHAHKRGTGTQSLDPMGRPTAAIVLRLIKGLEHKGYTLWMDNFYNSPALARYLKSLGFDCAGTLRTNRQYVPAVLANMRKGDMRAGQIIGCTSGDVDLLVWRDQNRVGLLSTYHGDTVTRVDGRTKPTLILDYNLMMGGVDKKDQMLAAYPVERKRTKVWYKKLFRRLLNCTVLNTYILIKQSRLPGSNITHRQCRHKLVVSLLAQHCPLSRPGYIPPNVVYPGHIHYLNTFPKMAKYGTGRRRRTCVCCKKRSTTYCVGCDKTVCMTPCFPNLHQP